MADEYCVVNCVNLDQRPDTESNDLCLTELVVWKKFSEFNVVSQAPAERVPGTGINAYVMSLSSK